MVTIKHLDRTVIVLRAWFHNTTTKYKYYQDGSMTHWNIMKYELCGMCGLKSFHKGLGWNVSLRTEINQEKETVGPAV